MAVCGRLYLHLRLKLTGNFKDKFRNYVHCTNNLATLHILVDKGDEPGHL